MAVTPEAPDPVAAAVAALIEHDATCDWCKDNLGLPGVPQCSERDILFAARRRALTGRAGEITAELSANPAYQSALRAAESESWDGPGIEASAMIEAANERRRAVTGRAGEGGQAATTGGTQ